MAMERWAKPVVVVKDQAARHGQSGQKKRPRKAAHATAIRWSHKMSRLLVIEDEFYIAAHIENVLRDNGHEVIGSVGTLGEARALARSEEFDGALLDVNLDDGRIDDVADILTSRHIPFLFLTACARENLPPAHRETVVVPKPFDEAELLREVLLLTQ
jgi:DNA-binding response OmpR family regulator